MKRQIDVVAGVNEYLRMVEPRRWRASECASLMHMSESTLLERLRKEHQQFRTLVRNARLEIVRREIMKGATSHEAGYAAGVNADSVSRILTDEGESITKYRRMAKQQGNKA